jgi:hypothetical protein
VTAPAAHEVPAPAEESAEAVAVVRRRRGDPAAGWFRRQVLVLVLVTFGVTAFLAGGHSYAIDNEVQFQTTRALVKLSPSLTDTDDGWLAREDGPYRRRDDGGVVGIVPIGQSLLSVPFYAGGWVLSRPLPADQRDQFVRTATFFTNALLHALAAAVVAALALEVSGSRRGALLVGWVYALGTYALPNAETYLTEVGTGMFMALACLLAVRSWRSGRWTTAAWSGVAMGWAFLVRPSAALFFPIVGLFVLVTAWRDRGLAAAVRSGAAWGVAAVGMLAVNGLFAWWRFGSPVDLGYQTVYQNHPLVDGAVNQLVSVGKGLVWFAPVVVLCVAGAVLAWRRSAPVVVLLTLCFTANLVFYARVPFWGGDNSWGPRYTLIGLASVVPLAAGCCVRRWGRVGVGALGVVGLVLPMLMGALVSFNTVYVEATRELGPGGETPAIRFDLEWQQILRHAGMLPEAVSDVLGDDPPGEVQRPPWTGDPINDYAFYGVEPRIDVWWLWIGPTGASGLTWVFLLLTVAPLGGAAWILWRHRGGGPAGWAADPALLEVSGSRRAGPPRTSGTPRPAAPAA